MLQPLAGVKVIEVGQALAGPLAGVVLADMGADVIKVEKPDGGGDAGDPLRVVCGDARGWGPPFAGDTSLYSTARTATSGRSHSTSNTWPTSMRCTAWPPTPTS